MSNLRSQGRIQDLIKAGLGWGPALGLDFNFKKCDKHANGTTLHVEALFLEFLGHPVRPGLDSSESGVWLPQVVLNPMGGSCPAAGSGPGSARDPGVGMVG